jgi:hypothetical protein
MGFATEVQLPGIPCIYGLPALFKVGFFMRVQAIFLLRPQPSQSSKDIHFDRAAAMHPRAFGSTNRD